MNFLQNRFLIDYAQHIIYNLLQRNEGAPFLGKDEKYFSIIDDTEIEIMKCIWETPERYIKIPPARRIWNTDFPELGEAVKSIDNPTYYAPSHSYKDVFIRLAQNTLSALETLESIKDQSSTLVFNRVDRCLFFMLAIQMKNWKNVYFFNGFRRAYEAMKVQLSKYPEYNHYLKSMHFLDTKDDICDISFIEPPCIVICNESLKSTSKIINNRDSDFIISYNGRI